MPGSWPLGPRGVVAHNGVLWVSVASARGGIIGLDLENGDAVAAVELGYPGALAVRAGALWATSEGGVVSRVDIGRRELTVSVEVGDHPCATVVHSEQVWVANSGSGTVSRINADTESVTGTVAVGPTPIDLAVGHGAVWVCIHGSMALVRLPIDF